ncbi:hypothetical protein GW17_00039542 [Ensete ventricosum]|nr:hypothetical protein GW17_00039542 [Ensete ventricosum]
MTLADDVNLEEFVMTKDEFSGADIKAICTEAGLLALRERRMKDGNSLNQWYRLVAGSSHTGLLADRCAIRFGQYLEMVTHADFKKAKEKVMFKKKEGVPEGLYM